MNDKDRMFVENDLRLTCADAVELVTDYLEDKLAVEDFDKFTAHLSLCEGCQIFVDQLKRTIKLVGEFSNDSIELRPKNFQALVNRLKEQGSRS